jgi:exopolysaccharide biosynthesis polyprenyl glycosylphosphotransferase
VDFFFKKKSKPIEISVLPARTNRPQLMPQDAFLGRLLEEERRAARSGRQFVLALVEGIGRAVEARGDASVCQSICSVTRETDISGWYKQGSILGIIYTELNQPTVESARDTILERLRSTQPADVNAPEAELSISAFILPRDLNDRISESVDPREIYGDIQALNSPKRRIALATKRVIDVLGSLFALMILVPIVFPILALAIRLTSKGPIFFRQQRIGKNGKRFTFLKFRSMYVANDERVHSDYVKQFIQGAAQMQTDDSGATMYKLTRDPRVTRIGRFIRKTSLDELPQFLNVLSGDMSLVGPRPPLPYELELYEPWHQRRILEVKPGITGLWQVCGRSQTSFDGMVRLDLRYVDAWSPWLDIKILFKTPSAVLGGAGAR